MTPDYSKGCARYDEITCDCHLSTNQCKGRDYYEQIQCGTIKSLKAQLSSKEQECERLKSMKESWEKTADDRKAQIQLKDRVAGELNLAFVQQEKELSSLRKQLKEAKEETLRYSKYMNESVAEINEKSKRCEDLEAALKGIIEDVDKQSMITWVSGKINTAKKLLSQ